MSDLDLAYHAAGKAMAVIDPDADVIFEWHDCEACPSVPCACSGAPYPSPIVRAAVDAARAPLLAEVERLKANQQPDGGEWRTEYGNSWSEPDRDNFGPQQYDSDNVQRRVWYGPVEPIVADDDD